MDYRYFVSYCISGIKSMGFGNTIIRFKKITSTQDIKAIEDAISRDIGSKVGLLYFQLIKD